MFHQVNAYQKYKKLLNTKNLPFPIENKHIGVFLQNNPSLKVKIQLFNSVIVSDTNMKIFEHRKIGKGRKNLEKVTGKK